MMASVKMSSLDIALAVEKAAASVEKSASEAAAALPLQLLGICRVAALMETLDVC